MKVCFAGVGSIALRHMQNLKELQDDIWIDAFHHRQSDSENRYVKQNYYNYKDLPDDYDVIFITNPTRYHYEALCQLHDKGKHFFIEKPVFMTGKEDISRLNLRKDSVYYVACPLRYTNVMEYLKNNLDLESVYSVRCISSSYLPDWRPNSDYRKVYSASKEMGGGVETDLIHEWDYIIHLFGFPQKVNSIFGKKSNLEIDSNDIAVYIAEYADKTVELHLDYFGRKPFRKIELFCDDDTIETDLINQRITWHKSGKTLDVAQERDSYQKKELEHFFMLLENQKRNDSTIEHAMNVLRIAKGISI